MLIILISSVYAVITKVELADGSAARRMRNGGPFVETLGQRRCGCGLAYLRLYTEYSRSSLSSPMALVSIASLNTMSASVNRGLRYPVTEQLAEMLIIPVLSIECSSSIGHSEIETDSPGWE